MVNLESSRRLPPLPLSLAPSPATSKPPSPRGRHVQPLQIRLAPPLLSSSFSRLGSILFRPHRLDLLHPCPPQRRSCSSSRPPQQCNQPKQRRPSSRRSVAPTLPHAFAPELTLLPHRAETSALLNNLELNTVIGPRNLSPQFLLTPFLPRPDLTKAYPLGPPTSAARTMDPFIALGISPLDSPMNPFLRAEFCTTMGKIKSRGKTGLQRGSQRKMGKAVRRARVSCWSFVRDLREWELTVLLAQSMGTVPVFGISIPGKSY